jgi:hypothetical protein
MASLDLTTRLAAGLKHPTAISDDDFFLDRRPPPMAVLIKRCTLHATFINPESPAESALWAFLLLMVGINLSIAGINLRH